MAEGGGEFGYKDPILDHDIDHDGDDDDDDDEHEVNTTGEFNPTLSSTQYPEEEHEMKTLQNEQSGRAETSYTEETPLLGSGAQSMKDKAWDSLTRLFPKSSATDLDASFTPKGKLQVKIAGIGKKAYDLFTKEKSTGKERLNPKLTQEILKGLGPKAEEIIAEDKEGIREKRQRLKEAEKQLQKSEKINAQKEKEAQEVEDLRIKLEQTEARLVQLGSDVENESEVRRLQQLKKNLKTDFENKKKTLAARGKQVKNIEKEKKEVYKLRGSLAAEEEKINTMEERFNSTKTFDELNEQKAELERRKEEYRTIINDENASHSQKETAREVIAEIEEEEARLATQIEERERAMPLRERVKEIFKKYGVTVTSILLAAGVTIGAVIGAITNALKSMGKALGNGLKEMGKKTASLLPGLIGQIVSFLFKTAGQVVGFLAEHVWVLILAVVAFLVEGYAKKQR